MNYSLLLAAALVLTASAASAQTETPAKVQVPGSLPVTPPEATEAGSPRAHRHTEKAPGMSHQDKKRLRKMVKVPANPDKAMKIK